MGWIVLSYPRAILVFSDLVITFKSGRTPVAQATSCKAVKIKIGIIYRLGGALYFNEAHTTVAGN